MTDSINLKMMEYVAAALKTVSQADIDSLPKGAVPAGWGDVVYAGDGTIFLSQELKALRFLFLREKEKQKAAFATFQSLSLSGSRHSSAQEYLKQRFFCELLRKAYETHFEFQYQEHLYPFNYAGCDKDFRIWMAGLRSPNEQLFASIGMGMTIVL